MQVSLKSAAGSDAGTVELADDVFGITPNVSVMHQVIVAQLAHRRADRQSQPHLRPGLPGRQEPARHALHEVGAARQW